MQTITWVLNAERLFGEVSGDIYGGFVEHLGRNVYGGVYDPASPTADAALRAIGEVMFR